MSSITSPSVPGGPFSVPPGVVRRTLDVLRQQRTEVICYWLGKTASGVTVVEDVWVPAHNASMVSYSVKPEEMLRLKQRLDETGWAIVAQVHSHPGEAFHSITDDQNAASPWPGFVSIVVPRFGGITPDFWTAAEVYELLGGSEWRHITEPEKSDRFARLR